MDALDPEVRRDLRGLSKEGAEWVAAHLVAAGALADEEPDVAWRHARAARARGGRIGVVRETVGLVAYRAGEWAEAIGELRAARRMGGGPGHLAVMADCERALGHPERAIELSRSTEADALDPEAATELQIVVAGARADLGQVDAALAQLERLGLDKVEAHPRMAYAYADLLLKAGRRDDAVGWFIRSANADLEEETDALERLAELGADEDLQDAVDDVPGADEAPRAADDADTSIAVAVEDRESAAEVIDVDVSNAGAGPDRNDGDPALTTDTDSTDTDSTDTDTAPVDETEADGSSRGVSDADTGDGDVRESGDRQAAVSDTDEAVSDTDEADAAGGATDVTAADVSAGPGEFTPTEFTDVPEAEEEEEGGLADENVEIIPTVLFSDDPQTGDR